MSHETWTFLALDLPAMLAGVLAAVTCGLLGNFLVLRRQSLMGDAISHAVLPGIVLGFIVAGSRETLPMFVGAGVSALAAVLIIEGLRRVARVEEGAAMGVGFSILFALGVLLIEQASARGVDLDAQCVLYGQLEYVNWYPPTDWSAWDVSLLRELPRQLWTLGGVTLASILFVGVFYKELRLTAFDPALASALGFRAGLVQTAMLVMVAAATVASFEAVGSILVIAMLIVPAATARLMTDRYSRQITISALLALVTGALGYVAGAFAPDWVGLRLGGSEIHALNVAGMIPLVGGAFLALAVFLAPAHGVVWRAVRRRRLALSVAIEDVLAALYRAEERSLPASEAPILTTPTTLRALSALLSQGLVERTRTGAWRLREEGRRRAASIVRRHRLWESWLVDEMGLRPDHVHQTAEVLEHLASDAGALEPDLPVRLTDPHQRPIPPEEGV